VSGINAPAGHKTSYAIRRLCGGLIELLYPSDVACTLCNRESVLGADGLCASCRETLTACPPFAAGPLDGLAAAFVYGGGAKLGIHGLKYNRQTRLAGFFASYMIVPENWRFDVVVPVPLHPFKLWLRTYNQSELLAKEICRRDKYALDKTTLRRMRFTRTQTALDETARRQNVSGAFHASSAARGRSFLLIDDVTTTHSTLLACASALRQAGAVRVYALCACAAGHPAQK
jgi:ComF family protein